jgi:hypothetical protein
MNSTITLRSSVLSFGGGGATGVSIIMKANTCRANAHVNAVTRRQLNELPPDWELSAISGDQRD